MSFKTKFSNLGAPEKIWVISAIHGDAARLTQVHKTIFDKFTPSDRLIYTGNYFCGGGADPAATMDELLHFRRTLMAEHLLPPESIVFLRGIQEEIWGKILQLQFAPNPAHVISWIQKQHAEIDILLQAYNSSLDETARIAREGVMCLTRWTSFMKRQVRQHPGHENFFSTLRRAAFTDYTHTNDNNLLFVHAGINPALPLVSQGDSFWWASKDFNALTEPYSPFRAVIRGYDPEHGGVHIGATSVTLDGGCGYGGKLICAELSSDGKIVNVLAA